MTPKDYVLIARALHAARAADDLRAASADFCLALDTTAERFALVLALDNPRFDRERFLKACREGC